jgi:hypothetical protein
LPSGLQSGKGTMNGYKIWQQTCSPSKGVAVPIVVLVVSGWYRTGRLHRFEEVCELSKLVKLWSGLFPLIALTTPHCWVSSMQKCMQPLQLLQSTPAETVLKTLTILISVFIITERKDCMWQSALGGHWISATLTHAS